MSDSTHRTLSLLHIEDSSADAELVAAVLRTEWPDCSILRVVSERALRQALNGDAFDAVLSDFTLPGFNGLEALAVVRKHDSTTPFIFLSGTIGEDNAVRALHEGATDYVLKDRIARLVPAIRRAVSEVEQSRIRKKTEDELRESQARFHELAERSAEVFWFVEPSPEKTLYVSPAFERIWGRRLSEVYADRRAWEDAIHADDRPEVRAAFNACLSGKAPVYEVEYRIIRPNGEIRWILDNGRPVLGEDGKIIRVCGIAKDITERRRSEEALREQAEVLAKARDAIVVSDLSRRIVYWNRGAETLFGWKAEEVVGKPSTEFFGASSIAEIDAVKQAMANDGWQGEVRLFDRSGRELVVDCRVTVIRDAEGKPKSHLIISTDITEKKQLERQFLRTQRLESIGTLAGGIAHDLNNVLAPIMMAVHLVQHRVQDPEIHRLMSILETSGQHGASLIRQVLAFAKGAEGQRTNIQLRLVIRDVVNLLEETLPRSISVQADLPGDLALVSADSTQVSQVLMNLCVNARDAMPEGGRLLITAENHHVTDSVARAQKGAQPGPHVLITVEDTGTGIPPSQIDRIFDPFFTTKPPGKGTGLGLSTALGIVRDHRGFVQVESVVGQGSRFRVYLPAAAGATVEAPSTPRPKLPSGSNELILVIDDEASVREIVRAFLETFGYRTLVAEDGARGLALLEESRGDIAAVITDMMMPGMQGAEVVERVRQLKADVPIVTMSGQLDPPDVNAGLPHHTRLQKPMTGEDLVLALQRVLPPKSR